MLARLLRRLGDRLRGDALDLHELMRLAASGRHDKAERILRRHLARRPFDPHALHALGLVCQETGRSDQAIQLIGDALALESHAVFHANLAEAFRSCGRLEEAAAHALQAVTLAPDEAEFKLKLASVIAQQHRLSDALPHVAAVLARHPEHFDALLLSGRLHGEMHQWDRALACYRKALRVRPGHPVAVVAAYRARAWIADWSHGTHELERLLERWADHPDARDFEGLHPFVAHEIDFPQSLRDVLTEAYAKRARKTAAGACFSHARRAKPRLRIGYVSADYHSHPTMHLMRGFFSRHDRARFEIAAYSLGPDDGSGVRQEVMASVDIFRDIRDMPTASAATAIHADGVDILVDLKGYTHSSRPGIFALGPAPLRVAWLGYPASTGHGINDYLIADRVVAPPEAAAHFGERLVWLPHSYQVTDDTQPIDAPPSRGQLGLPEAAVVFACFNHVYKIEPVMFSAWMRILQRVSGSVLWLYSDDPVARANLAAEARTRGVDPSRLVFAGTLPKSQHLARLKRADLFLDTLHINAHTGASDALWAGLPVLTCPGEGFSSRVGASVAAAAGLPQLVCRDLAQYEDKAVQLALDGHGLGELRRHLEERHASLPLFDTARFTRNLERAYQTMWERYLEGKPAAAFAVTEP